MPSSEPLPRRQQSRRRRGAQTAPEPMDWGAWLAGDGSKAAGPAGPQPGPSFPEQRPGSDPVVDLREVPPGVLAAELTAEPTAEPTGPEPEKPPAPPGAGRTGARST